MELFALRPVIDGRDRGFDAVAGGYLLPDESGDLPLALRQRKFGGLRHRDFAIQFQVDQRNDVYAEFFGRAARTGLPVLPHPLRFGADVERNILRAEHRPRQKHSQPCSKFEHQRALMLSSKLSLY